MSDLPEFLVGGERARLIPVAPSGHRERQACSVLLAVLSVVYPFARHVFSRMGYRLGRRSWIEAYTEIVFKKQDPDDADDRPDGLLLARSTQSEWSAIIEAKIGASRIKPDQIARYYKIAKANRIDAIITISNELTTRPDHLPYDLPTDIGGGVAIFHWSWPTLCMIAAGVVKEASSFDEEQAFILKEAIRYFDHQNSEIRGLTSMPSSWNGLVQRLRAGAAVRRDDADVIDALRSWHQAQASFCVALTREVGVQFNVKLRRQYQYDQQQLWADDLSFFVENNQLSFEFEVPDAPGELHVTVDVQKRNVICSLLVAAPSSPKQYVGKLNWLLKQLPPESDATASIHVIWKHGRRTSAGLSELRSNPEIARIEKQGAQPRAFEIVAATDLDRKFGPQSFPQAVQSAILDFYETVVKHLRAPKSPRSAEGAELIDEDAEDAWMPTA
ncbi:hypothetical protein, partial [Methyloceanibacter sp.]|uniref:hypothetical protein n=1 Tax=Methyloceanibacter sp. TaxID=1965321 RepID=UPI002D53ACD5